jgi:molybdate transport system regulatory protein
MNERASKASSALLGALTPKAKVWLEVGDRFAVGEWGAVLLEAVRDRGSLRQAAAAVGWSYRHAWDYVQRMEHALGLRLVIGQAGRPREGSRLTREGDELIRMLHDLQRVVQEGAERRFREHIDGARGEAGERPRSRRSPSHGSRRP